MALNPTENVVHASPDARVDRFCTTISPRRCAVDLPDAAGLAHQGAATVALAGISDPLRVPPLCAEHGRFDLTVRVAPCRALPVGHCFNLHLLQVSHNIAPTGGGAPPCDPTCGSWRHILLWQTHRAHTAVHLHWRFQAEKGDIEVHVVRIVRWMRDRLSYPNALPATASSEGAGANMERTTQAMSSREDPPRIDQHPSTEMANAVFKRNLPDPLALAGGPPIDDGGVGPHCHRFPLGTAMCTGL